MTTTLKVVSSTCVACKEKFAPDRGNQRRCRPCLEADRRPAKTSDAVDVQASLDIAQALSVLQAEGYRVLKDSPQTPIIRLADKKTKRFRFGVVSDTHLGSKHQQLTHLHGVYKRFGEEGVEAILHGGDLTHGSVKMHRDMAFECHKHGAVAQAKYAVDVYPSVPGVMTYLIDGNHDLSHQKEGEGLIVKEVAGRRADMEYLGSEGAYFTVGGVRVYLWHPRGGGAHARSWRVQKWIEAVAPADKPHVVLQGHLHTPVHVPAYRNVEGFSLPCFQSQTPFERGKALHPTIGGMILDLEISESGLEEVGVRWLLHRIPVPNDY